MYLYTQRCVVVLAFIKCRKKGSVRGSLNKQRSASDRTVTQFRVTDGLSHMLHKSNRVELGQGHPAIT